MSDDQRDNDKKKVVKVVANISVGKPDVRPTAPGHVAGVYEGNRKHASERPNGLVKDTGDRAEGTSRRSTGVRPKSHEAIDPRMPKLSPA